MGIAALIGFYLLVIGLVIVLLAGIYAVVTYNRFVHLKTTVESALSDVDVHLTKRYNLIPNLVETVKGYAEHESGVFEEVTALRSRAMQATSLDEKARCDDSLRGLFKSLFAVAENYPALKADANFQQLQKTLQELENSIESGRRYYNAAVREHNILLNSFPANIVGRMFSFIAQPFFESAGDQERQTPQVDF